MAFRRHRRLLNLIDHLPQGSEFVEAYSNDPDTARAIVEGLIEIPDEDAEPSGPRLSEWTPEVAKLAEVVDRLSELISIQIARAGKKPPRVKPSPRPVTEVGKARAEAKREKRRRNAALIIEQLTPGEDVGSI